MNAKVDAAFLSTLHALNAIERGPQVRRYAPDPAADEAAHEVSQFQRQCARDAAWRDARSEQQEEADYAEEIDTGWDAETQMAYFGSDRR